MGLQDYLLLSYLIFHYSNEFAVYPSFSIIKDIRYNMSTEWSTRRNKAHSLLKERRSRRKHQEGALAESTQIHDSPFVTPVKLDFGSESLSEVQEQIPLQQTHSPICMETIQNEITPLTAAVAAAESPPLSSPESAQELESMFQKQSPEPKQDILLPRSPHRTSHLRPTTQQVQEYSQSSTLHKMPERQLIILISVGVSDRNQATHQDRSLTIMKGRGTPFEMVDGMDPSQTMRRNQLFAISGIRGNYPQFFFAHPDGSTSFLGGWERIEEINENSTLSPQILNNNPGIETWGKFFDGVVEKFSL